MPRSSNNNSGKTIIRTTTIRLDPPEVLRKNVDKVKNMEIQIKRQELKETRRKFV